MKKLLSLALAILMLAVMLPVVSMADEIIWEGSNNVYWQAGNASGQTPTLADALKAAYMANKGDITITCRPNSDVGSLTHGHVADNITIIGNGAYISGGECDLEVDTYRYDRTTGKQDENGAYLEKNITITASNLYNLGVWGQRHTSYTVNINLTNCDSKAISGMVNVQRVYISGATGVNNITVQGALSIPVGGGLDCDIYEGEYNIVPSDTVQVLPTANKLLKHDIVIEANSGGLPEGSEMATDDDIDGLIDDIFGTGVNPDPDEPTYSPDDIATEKELNDAIADVFG